MNNEDGDRLIPSTHMIKAIRVRRYNLPELAMEFIDNSLDHGRSDTVLIVIDNEYGIAVQDDGIGVSDINRIFQYGAGNAYNKISNISMFGVGAKDASIWLGNRVKVETVRNGRRHTMQVDWNEVDRTGLWPRRYKGQGQPAKGNGTVIQIQDLNHHFQLSTTEKMSRLLGQTFAPGLRNGAKIQLLHRLKNGTEQRFDIQPFEPEEMTDVILIEGVIETGIGTLRWSGRAGLSEKLTETHNGVHIAFGHRVIETARDPFNGRSAPTVYAEIALDVTTPWKYALSDHKTRIVKYRAELMRSIADQIRELVERSAQKSRDVALSLMMAPIENKLARAILGAGDLNVDPDEEPESGGGEGKTKKRAKHKKNKLRTPIEEGESAKERKRPTGIKTVFKEKKQLEEKFWSWDVEGSTMIISLDRDYFEPMLQWPIDYQQAANFQNIIGLVSHAIESEYMANTGSLIKLLSPKLRKQIDEWAEKSQTKLLIAPYVNRALMEAGR